MAICRHPALSAPARKELHIFDDENRDWDSPDYSDLDQWYAAGDEGRLRYDATPIYSYWRPSLERIRRYNPQARLVFLFRDPFARAWSQWCMEYARGETMPFAQALREGRQRMRIWPPLSTAERTYSYIERSFYGQQVVRALRLFPRSQLLFLKSEDLARDHMGTLQRIADFLQVEPFAPCPICARMAPGALSGLAHAGGPRSGHADAATRHRTVRRADRPFNQRLDRRNRAGALARGGRIAQEKRISAGPETSGQVSWPA
jgi:hypothetical protein